jgi:aubergine-like protein
MLQDLATHTRVSPAQRQLAMRKYCENVNSHPEARKELAKWGLELDMDCVNVSV